LKVLLWALCLAPMFASTAGADSNMRPALPGRTRILMSGCSERTNERALLEQVRIELLSAGIPQIDVVQIYAEVGADEQPSYDVATVRIDLPDCAEPGWDIDLAIAYRQTGRHVRRTLKMSDTPEAARPRAVALAMVELLRGNWRELASEPETTAAYRSPPDTEKPPGMLAPKLAAADPERSARPRIEWTGATRIYPQTDSGDLATSLSISQKLGARLRVHGGGTAAGGGGDGSNVHIFQGTSRFALSLCSMSQELVIEVGTAWEVGYAQLRVGGSGRKSGLVAIGAVQATLRMPVSPGIETLLNLQAGYVLAPLTAQVELDDGRRRSTGLEGSVLGVGIGLAGIL
jgi:hypothetical protein